MRNALVVARSKEALEFITKYCKNTKNIIIDHGINADKFIFEPDKENYFIVCSQLIERKRIDGILDKFVEFLKKASESGVRSSSSYKLYIVGDGKLKAALVSKTKELEHEDSIIFTGKLSHDDMIPLLSRAKALLINIVKDNSMISVVESIAVETPVIMTDVALNASYIRENELGIVDDNWGYEELVKIVDNNEEYVNNCKDYRYMVTDEYKAEQFIRVYEMYGLR